jgi:hypothetical protein
VAHCQVKFVCFASQVVECCRELERLDFGDKGDLLILERSDILAIASLPRLKSLKINNCDIVDGNLSALSRVEGA